jgi:hypothetical protein
VLDDPPVLQPEVVDGGRAPLAVNRGEEAVGHDELALGHHPLMSMRVSGNWPGNPSTTAMKAR